MRRRRLRGADARPPAQLLRMHRHSRSNLLVLGGTETQRLAVARAFHRARSSRDAPIVALDCAHEESRLSRALQSWLTSGGPEPGANPLGECERGTLYLDSIGCLSGATQRLLLILARRIESGSSDSLTEPGPVRLAAGNAEDLSEAVEQHCFSSSLFDCLDKIRVGIGRAWRQGAA